MSSLEDVIKSNDVDEFINRVEVDLKSVSYDGRDVILYSVFCAVRDKSYDILEALSFLINKYSFSYMEYFYTVCVEQALEHRDVNLFKKYFPLASHSNDLYREFSGFLFSKNVSLEDKENMINFVRHFSNVHDNIKYAISNYMNDKDMGVY